MNGIRFAAGLALAAALLPACKGGRGTPRETFDSLRSAATTGDIVRLDPVSRIGDFGQNGQRYTPRPSSRWRD